jgi:DNA-binding transcriptional LysR family regulator
VGQSEAVSPQQLTEETLITYPVPVERLDIYTLFLLPAKVTPRRHKTIETTDIMLQMVASGRGVTALPKWLVTDYAPHLQLRTLRLGHQAYRSTFIWAPAKPSATSTICNLLLRWPAMQKAIPHEHGTAAAAKPSPIRF